MTLNDIINSIYAFARNISRSPRITCKIDLQTDAQVLLLFFSLKWREGRKIFSTIFEKVFVFKMKTGGRIGDYATTSCVIPGRMEGLMNKIDLKKKVLLRRSLVIKLYCLRWNWAKNLLCLRFLQSNTFPSIKLQLISHSEFIKWQHC